MSESTPPVPRRWFQFGLWSLFVATLIVALCGGLIKYMAEDRLCLFHFSAGRSILIQQEMPWEILCPFYYRVEYPGQPDVTQHWFSDTDRPQDILPEHFRAFELPDGLVVVQQLLAGNWEDVIVHDFATGTSFPGNTAKKTDFRYDLDGALPAQVERWRKRPVIQIQMN